MTVTVGTDSFISLADAGAYFAGRLYATAWTGSTDPDREKALRMASAILNRERWAGSITSANQLLAWPRSGAVDQEGRAIDAAVIPAAVRDATSELALALLVEDLTQNDGNAGVKTVQAGSVRIEYNGQAPARRLPDVVAAIIRPLLSPPGGASTTSAALVF